ncbi:MAG: hypothetical protein ACE5DM_03685 [Candidatus Nanoarchaeia archaeon]
MKRKRRVQWYHILFVIVVSVCAVIIFASKTGIFEKDISNATLYKTNFSYYWVGQDNYNQYNLSFSVRNNLDRELDCILNITVESETYKNSTYIDIPVLEPLQEIRYRTLVEVENGSNVVTAEALC